MQQIRQRLRETIVLHLEPLQETLAMSEDGSASFGRDDELSDLDFMIIVEDGKTEPVAQNLASAIESVAPIARRFELPAPTWHGAWQTFYQLEGYPMHLVDACIVERSMEWTLTEVERHGTPVVLFDKGGFIKTSNVDMEKARDDMRAKLARLEPTVNMFHLFVDKEVARGRLIDAMHFYTRMILYPLIDVLRMKHDPARHDFSGRYLYFDLPSEVAKEVESLFLVKDSADLLIKKARAVAMFNEAIKADTAPR